MMHCIWQGGIEHDWLNYERYPLPFDSTRCPWGKEMGSSERREHCYTESDLGATVGRQLN
jgi:hypothetical protein